MQISRFVHCAAALAAALLTGCAGVGQSGQYMSGADHDRHVDGILKFAYDTPSPTTAWETADLQAEHEALTRTDGAGLDAKSMLALLRREDAAGTHGQPADPATAPQPLAAGEADAQQAYLETSLSRLAPRDAPDEPAVTPGSVATVTQMPDFAHPKLTPMNSPQAREDDGHDGQ